MKYLCLIYQDETKLDSQSSSARDTLVAETLAYDEEMRKSGHSVASHALELAQTATSIRIRDGKLSVTDGPFVESTAQLSGYILIEARDLNEAIRVAARIPPARTGGVELRPVKELTVQ